MGVRQPYRTAYRMAEIDFRQALPAGEADTVVDYMIAVGMARRTGSYLEFRDRGVAVLTTAYADRLVSVAKDYAEVAEERDAAKARLRDGQRDVRSALIDMITLVDEDPEVATDGDLHTILESNAELPLALRLDDSTAASELARRTSAMLASSAAEYEAKRAERLARRPPPASTEMPTRRCSACGKKPARIDDLCKKCARERGIIVRGKIGASDG